MPEAGIVIATVILLLFSSNFSHQCKVLHEIRGLKAFPCRTNVPCFLCAFSAKIFNVLDISTLSFEKMDVEDPGISEIFKNRTALISEFAF